jgi:hypothetical protein
MKWRNRVVSPLYIVIYYDESIRLVFACRFSELI